MVDVEEKLRVVLLVMLVMLLWNKVRELKAAGLFSLNASGVVRRGALWAELLKNEMVRDADIFKRCGWSWIYMADM